MRVEPSGPEEAWLISGDPDWRPASSPNFAHEGPWMRRIILRLTMVCTEDAIPSDVGVR